TTTLSASGASAYVWNTGATTPSISASPSVTTIYNVMGTYSNNCQATLYHTLTVNAVPVITVNSGSICLGSSFTITPGGATTYTIQGGNAVVSPTANATYTVIGTNSLGCVSNSAAVSSITVVVCAGVSENSGVLNGTNLYPNPNKGVFTIELPVQANVSVINVIGKEILNRNIEAGKNTINLTDFSTGVYFVKVKSGESQVIYKVIAE
ncbi:MAG TPA: T9SS type A sorting domain-containing protein, partial [Bacteroidia bacterium]|nr:T9SS type A sorting domain-containing protein [Bacteroidia bacterium]